MIASKFWGLVAFLAACLVLAMAATPLIRRAPKSTRDGGRASSMRRHRKFTGDAPQNIAVDSAGRMVEESVGGSQQDINAMMQINAQGNVVSTRSKESMDDVIGEYDHANVAAPSLCHDEIVSEMCMALNNQTKEYYNTETDADTSIVHAAELAEQLSASTASVLGFLNEIGATNLETDKYLLDHGAFAVKCMDLCLKVVDSIPQNLRPPTSDVACIPAVDPAAAPDCNIDVSPKALDAITEAKLYPGDDDTHGDFEGGLKEADKDDAFEATEKEKNGINEILDQQNEDKSFRQLQVDVALLFRIHPVADVFVDMDDKNMSDEPHLLDAGNASRTHFLNSSSLAGLENSRMSHKSSLAISRDIARLNNIARAWLSSTINMMAGGRANRLVQKWFKSSDRNTINDVRKTMDSAANVLSYVHYKKGWQCRWMPNVLAYVRPIPPFSRQWGFFGRYIVALCDLWLTQSEFGKVQTLVHEAMHHLPAWEKDERYGACPCLQLGRNQAINNADSMAYFAMEAHGRRPC